MILISNRSVKSDTVKMAIISVLNWLWRKSIDLFHLWKTGFRSEFALKWNQFGGLLTQCLGTTGPHHTITLLLFFSLVAFTLERQGIIGERKAKMGLQMKVDLGESDNHESGDSSGLQGGGFWWGGRGRIIDFMSSCQDSYLYIELLFFKNLGMLSIFLSFKLLK